MYFCEFSSEILVYLNLKMNEDVNSSQGLEKSAMG